MPERLVRSRKSWKRHALQAVRETMRVPLGPPRPQLDEPDAATMCGTQLQDIRPRRGSAVMAAHRAGSAKASENVRKKGKDWRSQRVDGLAMIPGFECELSRENFMMR